jgi:hypothetical protein
LKRPALGARYFGNVGNARAAVGVPDFPRRTSGFGGIISGSSRFARKSKYTLTFRDNQTLHVNYEELSITIMIYMYL